MAAGMNAPLYTTEILRLAASLSPSTRLSEAHGTGEKRSTTCGSHVRTEVIMDEDGCVAEIAQQVQACAFGQASASLLDRSARGKTRDQIAEARKDFAAWLIGEQDEPGPWPGMIALEPARPKRARHAAMLLPFDALIAAIDDARERART
jgi:NifU-like protein involved in Fe-S cluster formation